MHINGLNLEELVLPQGGTSLVETMQRNFDAIREQGERLGRPVLAHLNHPNFHWAFTAEDIARMRGERFFEVYNGHPGVHNRGDEAHTSSEAMWARPASSMRPPTPSSILARSRRRLKNSDFCAAVVPVRTTDQLRRM